MKALGIQITRDKWQKTQGLEIFEAETPAIDPNTPEDAYQVIIQPLIAGFCGSDRNVWYRTAFEDIIYDSMQAQAEHHRILGHEFVGRIMEVGKEAEKACGYKPGDIVSTESHIYCGLCPPCKAGKYHICTNDQIIGFSRNGGFAEAIKLPAKVLWPVDPQKIRLEVAAIMEPFGNAIHACTVTEIKDKNIAIFGCGPIGMFTILVAKAIGAKNILVIEPDPKHIELANALGVDEVIQADLSKSKHLPFLNNALIKEVVNYFDGEGPDVSFEMAGFNDSVNHAILSAKRGGNIILFGIKSGQFVLPEFSDIIMHGKHLHGVIGRRLFDTWEKTQTILEDKSNQVQEKVFDVILNGGQDTIVDFHDFQPDTFETSLNNYPKILFKLNS